MSFVVVAPDMLEAARIGSAVSASSLAAAIPTTGMAARPSRTRSRARARVVFGQGFNNALQTMYATAMADPVHAANGRITDAASSSEFAIEVGALMTVNDPVLMLTPPLADTGMVVMQGDPRRGWTLVSWDGVPVPPASRPGSGMSAFILRRLAWSPMPACHRRSPT
ncbi:hypothetical protein [Mycobacterium helveticum]|uniref:Uncharacterized protein n=1 Tax=Mycobacterium helveticum TaxID=2592811 RepID=A0A557XJ86_9MYCO|nr:hypothetical protein [Mycobacterium helveticum]TVS83761.1 hypothetical protein FPZ46_19775 [Mycobacterium helveticum]TVS85802.1 hypothetical protein FPZ47_19265 [Mycobacterium helveticum]